MRRRRLLALPALGLAAGLLLVGCGDDEKNVTVDGTDYSVSDDGDEVKVESSDGSYQGTTGKLPDGFPSDDVPLIDAPVDAAYGATAEGQGRTFTVGLKVEGDVGVRFDEAVSDLKDAGYTSTNTSSVGSTRLASFEGEAWDVMLTADTEQTTISYVVTSADRNATSSPASTTTSTP